MTPTTESVSFTLLDVFAEDLYQGTQIPVVITHDHLPAESMQAIADEFNQTDTVFISPNSSDDKFRVFNQSREVGFGAHTTLAAGFMANELKMTEDQGSYSSIDIEHQANNIECFIDKEGDIEKVQFKQIIEPQIDRYIPSTTRIAEALNIEEKHFNHTKFQPLMVCVDNPVLILPVTKPEHVLAAQLDRSRWSSLLSETYATDIFLLAPGTITNKTDFHGRLMNPSFAPQEYPPIGKVIPEFVAFLSEQKSIANGTHIFSIDRGSPSTRKSILSVEFDKKPGVPTQCRIGGHVKRVGSGTINVK